MPAGLQSFEIPDVVSAQNVAHGLETVSTI